MDEQIPRHGSSDSIPDTWTCAKHGTLPISEFYRCHHQVKYWRWKCKRCAHDSIKKRYHADPKTSHARNYAWRKDNKEKWQAISQKWYERHGHELRSKQKQERDARRMIVLCHYAGDPPKCALCNESNQEFLVLDHINNDGAEQRARLKRVTTRFYDWVIKNNFPDDLRILCQNCNAPLSYDLHELIDISLNGKSYTKYRAKLRLTVLNHYSPDGIKCSCCGLDDVTKLAIDHIKGGGREQRRQIGFDSTTMYRWLIKNNFPEDFRVLCHNCNHSLGAYGYCPHQLDESCFALS